MSYKKAEQVLPIEIVELIQNYIDGECIYIPRKKNNRKPWGEKTTIRQELSERNIKIYEDYKNGLKIATLAEKYFLSEKSIQRIIYKIKLKVKHFDNKYKISFIFYLFSPLLFFFLKITSLLNT